MCLCAKSVFLTKPTPTSSVAIWQSGVSNLMQRTRSARSVTWWKIGGTTSMFSARKKCPRSVHSAYTATVLSSPARTDKAHRAILLVVGPSTSLGGLDTCALRLRCRPPTGTPDRRALGQPRGHVPRPCALLRLAGGQALQRGSLSGINVHLPAVAGCTSQALSQRGQPRRDDEDAIPHSAKDTPVSTSR